MHRKLPSELSLHILSFLTFNDALLTKQINKNNNKITELPSFWKSRLKKEFDIQQVKEIKNPQEEFKKLYKQLTLELERHTALMEAYLFSLEIKRCKTISDHQTGLLDFEIMTIFRNRDHLIRLERLDRASLRSNEIFLQEFLELKKQHPEVDQEKVKNQALSIRSCNNNEFIHFLESLEELDKATLSENVLLGLPKVDAHITLRNLTDREKMPQSTLGDLLHVACAFLNIKSAQVLLELGANINHFKSDCDMYRGYSDTTPLFAAMNAFYIQKKLDPTSSNKPAMELIQFLLVNGADPNARIYISEDTPESTHTQAYEDKKKSIYEFCLFEKQDPNHIMPEILDLIISASNTVVQTNNIRKRL